MRIRRGEFEQIRRIVERVGVDQPLTAKELHALLDEHGASFDSPHRVATVLGRRADDDDVEIIRGHPYRYRLDTDSS